MDVPQETFDLEVEAVVGKELVAHRRILARVAGLMFEADADITSDVRLRTNCSAFTALCARSRYARGDAVAVLASPRVHAYSVVPWESFFLGEVGATAALTGLLFVAVSINLRPILEYPWLPALAGETLLILPRSWWSPPPSAWFPDSRPACSAPRSSRSRRADGSSR